MQNSHSLAALSLCFAPLLISAATTSALAGDTECNGKVEDVPLEGPYPEMTCVNVSCGGSCSLDGMELSADTWVYWCECDPSGEPDCCHTIQKKINGEYQAPTGWGICRGALGCPGSCTGNAFAGFKCQ